MVLLLASNEIFVGDEKIAKKLRCKNWNKDKVPPPRRYIYGQIMAIDYDVEIARVSVNHEDYLIGFEGLQKAAYRVNKFDF